MDDKDQKENSAYGDRGENEEEPEMEDELYTTEEAMDKIGIGAFQLKIIFLSGFVWMARGFELVVLRMIGNLITCTWHLKMWQGALMSTVTVLSTVIGCFLYGFWSDKYGRRNTLFSSLVFLFVFGAVSAGLPNYVWFVIFRAIVGFSIGGLPQAFVACCENVPSRHRGRSIYILSCFWALGVILNLALLYFTLNTPGTWRAFMAIGSIPAFLAMILMRFFPESYRFLLVSNQYTAANEIVSEMAEANGQTLQGRLKPIEMQYYRGRIEDFFNTTYTKTTLLFWLLGLLTAFSFVGLTVLTPPLIREKFTFFTPINTTVVNFVNEATEKISCARRMTNEEFVFTVGTTALDFPGLVIYMILVDLVDRKKLLSASYFLSTVFIFLLFVKVPVDYVLVIFLYISRTILISQFDMLLLMVAESYPTTHRGIAIGLEAASFYLGQFISIYATQALLTQNLMYPIVAFGILTFVCAVAAAFLGPEARGKDLRDIHQESSFST